MGTQTDVVSEWKQLGLDIDGEANYTRSGYSVSMSADGLRVAIGALFNNGNGTNSGHVRVYEWKEFTSDMSGNYHYTDMIQNDTTQTKQIIITQEEEPVIGDYYWTQLGEDIDGEAQDDRSGHSVSMSADGLRVAIGATFNNGNGSNSGHVRVYELSGNSWGQIGQDIDGEAADDRSGYSVSMSVDGSRVAIGAPFNDGNGSNSGHVRVYELSGNSWVQLGKDIDGEAAGNESGYSVSISDDGLRLAIGAIYNHDNGTSSGHVRVYEFDGNSWSQIGQDIDGENSYDRSGYSVSISADGSRVAIGALYNNGNGAQSGHVRVYEISGNNWTQVGQDIDGENSYDRSGWYVSMSADGSRVAIGTPFNNVNSVTTGHVRVYEWKEFTSDMLGNYHYTDMVQNDTQTKPLIITTREEEPVIGDYYWAQLGKDIDGEFDGDQSGLSVSMSADGSRVAIGAPYKDSQSGHVCIYELNEPPVVEDIPPVVEDIPPVVEDISLTIVEDESVNIKLEGSDIDGDDLTYIIETNPSNGKVEISGNEVIYTPDENYNGENRTMTIYVDGGSLSEPYYRFYSDSSGENEISNVLNTNIRYVFKRLDDATSHPFYIENIEGIELSGDGSENSGITGQQELILEFKTPIQDYLYDFVGSGTTNRLFTYDWDTSGVSDYVVRDTDIKVEPNSNTFSHGDNTDGIHTPVNLTGAFVIELEFRTDLVNPYDIVQAGLLLNRNEPLSNNRLYMFYEDEAIAVYDDEQQYIVYGVHPDHNPSFNQRNLYKFNHTLNSGVFKFRIERDNTGNVVMKFDVTADDGTKWTGEKTTTYTKPITDLTLLATEFQTYPPKNIYFEKLFVEEVSDNSITVNYKCTAHPSIMKGAFELITNDDSFTYKANDGLVDSNVATVSIIITPVNDEPTTQDISGIIVLDNSSVEIEIIASDVDGDELTYSLVNDESGKATINGNIVTYTPELGDEGGVTLEFTVTDGSLNTSGNIFIEVKNSNTPPTIDNITDITMNEGETKKVDISVNDAEGDELSYNILHTNVSGVLQSVSLVENNTKIEIVAEPQVTTTSTEVITLQVSDNQYTEETSFNVTVEYVNDEPVVEDISLTIVEGIEKSFNLLGTDENGDNLSYSIVSDVTNGTLQITDNIATYTPNVEFSGVDSFTYKATDGDLDSKVATVSITVSDEEVAGSLTSQINEKGTIQEKESVIDQISNNNAVESLLVTVPELKKLLGDTSNDTQEEITTKKGKVNKVMKLKEQLREKITDTEESLVNKFYSLKNQVKNDTGILSTEDVKEATLKELKNVIPIEKQNIKLPIDPETNTILAETYGISEEKLKGKTLKAQIVTDETIEITVVENELLAIEVPLNVNVSLKTTNDDVVSLKTTITETTGNKVVVYNNVEYEVGSSITTESGDIIIITGIGSIMVEFTEVEEQIQEEYTEVPPIIDNINMSSTNFTANTPANTEVPAFNVSFFLRDEAETKNTVLNATKLGISNEEFNSVMAEGFEFNAYYQNLKLGDGTTNSVQLPHKFRADGLPNQRTLLHVASEGSAVQKYSLTGFSQNSDATDGPEEPKHIGLNVKHAPETGVYVFQHANVCYENTNGFNVTVRSSLRSILSNYTAEGTIYAYVIVTPVENIDVLGKTGSNMSDFAVASNVASGVLDADASGNNLIISQQRVAVTGETNDFKVSLGGSNIIRDVFMNILVDIYRSQRTTLIAPMIILNKLPNVEKIKHELLSDPTGVFNIDQNQVDIAKHYMVVNRIVLNDSSKNLLESFESTETDVKAYSILRENPGRRLTLSELNGANAYDTDVLSFKTALPRTTCGHDNVEIETLVFFTSLLSRSLISRTDLLDNVYWYLQDSEAGQFTIVPETLLDVSGQQPELEMISYRKAVVSQLLASVPSKQSLFVRNYESAKVPSIWFNSTETYDAFGTIQLIKDYEYRLKGVSKQFPLYYEKQLTEDVVDSYLFPSLNYYGELKMDGISRSFVDDYFGEGWLENFLNEVGTTDAAEWLTQAQEFVAHAKTKNVILSQSLTNLSEELASVSSVSEFNKYSLLLVTCLHHLVNSAEDTDFTFQPSKMVGSTVNVMKNRYERIPLTIELSVERLPRNLLLETTSLRLSEVTFVNNTSLRLSILDSVGNPVNMILPVLLELKTKDVEVTQRREFELLTDYLVDVLDRIDKTYLMNCIWYTVDEEGKREVVRAEPFGRMFNSQYGVIQSETLPVRADVYALPKMLYNKMMGDAEDNATGQQLKSSPDAMMKLNNTKDDVTARGELRDYRYHGINENIYAEDPPSQTGGFASQVLRWIKSGLINKPEDNTIIGNEDLIIQHIRTKAFDTSGDEMIELEDTVDSAGDTQNAVKTFLKQKLVDSISDTSDYSPLQNLLEHIYSIDKQRFTINEVARSRVVENDLMHNGLPLHMLPIISDDTISILTTVNGRLVDPNEGTLGSPNDPATLAGAMELINQRLRNPGHLNPTPDTDRIGSVTMSVTGNAIDAENKIGAPGIYSNCVNLLVAPEVGPFEKSVAEGVEQSYPVTYNGKTIYSAVEELPEYNPLTYQAFRERSWTVRYNLDSNVDTQTYEQIRVAQFNAESGSNEDSGGVVAQPGTTNLGEFGASTDGLTYPLSLLHYQGVREEGDLFAEYTFTPHGVGVTNLISQINSTINETTNTITTKLQNCYDNVATSDYLVLTNRMNIYGNGELFAMLGAFGSQPNNFYSINIQTSETEKVTFKVLVDEMAFVQGLGMVMIIKGFDSNNLADLMTYLDLAYQNGIINIYNDATGEYGTDYAAVRLESGKKLLDKTLLGTSEYPDTRFSFELFVHGSGPDFETHGVTTEVLKNGLQGTYTIDTAQIESLSNWLVDKPTNVVPQFSSLGSVGFNWYNDADPAQATLRITFNLMDNQNSISNNGGVYLDEVNNTDGPDIELANSFIGGLSLMVNKVDDIVE